MLLYQSPLRKSSESEKIHKVMACIVKWCLPHRVLKSLGHWFSTPARSEELFTYHQNKDNLDSIEQCEGQKTPSLSTNEDEVSSGRSCPIELTDTLKPSIEKFCRMEPEDHLTFVSKIFTAYCSRQNIAVPQDFPPLTIKHTFKQLLVNQWYVVVGSGLILTVQLCLTHAIILLGSVSLATMMHLKPMACGTQGSLLGIFYLTSS